MFFSVSEVLIANPVKLSDEDFPRPASVQSFAVSAGV
jgi:hypothetical protein